MRKRQLIPDRFQFILRRCRDLTGRLFLLLYKEIRAFTTFT